jgi:hypothetical protein
MCDTNLYIAFKIPTMSHCYINPLNDELNPICHLLALLAHHIFNVRRMRVNIFYMQNDLLL